jgi:D-glycero-D-manno-heptose 1,7-bisphosphate phosphatase
MPASIKLVVIDRDGLLSQDPEAYVRGPEDWQPLPGAVEAVARLNHAGWRVVIATNQTGIGRGLFDVASFNAFNTRMHKAMAEIGARIDAIFFCPHAPEEDCDCRKPAPGLFHQICSRYGVPPEQVQAAGDSVRDAQAAAAAGCKPHLILSGKSIAYRDGGRPEGLPPGTLVHRDLQAFAEWVLKHDSGS